jgi:hypothetical protein
LGCNLLQLNSASPIRLALNCGSIYQTLLDPVTKLNVTICNLFANHELPILDIMRVLDEEYRHVVRVLIEQGLVFERRRSSRAAAQAEPERSLFRNRA